MRSVATLPVCMLERLRSEHTVAAQGSPASPRPQRRSGGSTSRDTWPEGRGGTLAGHNLGRQTGARQLGS